jgi:hypothetical protein
LSNQFICGSCGETYTKAWSDEEAQAEAERVFSEDELRQTTVICEECWQQTLSALADFKRRYEEKNK